MSAATQALARELGCEHRTFKRIKDALVWFARYRSGDKDDERMIPAVTNIAARGRAQNTYAMLLLALRPTAPGIDGFTLVHTAKLVEWHCAYIPQSELAKDWGFPSQHALKLTMRWTEQILRVRLEARGLLEEET